MSLLVNGSLIDIDAPDPIGQLVEKGYLYADCQHCPTGDRPYQLNLPVIRTPLAELADPTRKIMLYEDPANHGGKGGCVAFADGHIEFVYAADMKRVLEEGTLP